MGSNRIVFIIGSGRCGSTKLYDVLSHHPQVSWMSSLCSRFPDKLWMNRLAMTSIDIPFFRYLVRKKVKPSESYLFWEYYYRGFSTPYRDLVESDVSLRVESALKSALQDLITERRKHLFIKITGWPRIRFLHEIFPDAMFIHILRDGRAVANSALNVPFWRGWQGPENWRWGDLPPSMKEEWERYDNSFVVLAALQWKILMDAVCESKKALPLSRFLEVKYEELVSQPMDTFRRITQFAGLEWSSRFEQFIVRSSFKNMNYKWKEELTVGQKSDLNACLHDYLRRFGYESDC